MGDLFGQAGAGLALLGVLTAASGAAVLALSLIHISLLLKNMVLFHKVS